MRKVVWFSFGIFFLLVLSVFLVYNYSNKNVLGLSPLGNGGVREEIDNARGPCKDEKTQHAFNGANYFGVCDCGTDSDERYVGANPSNDPPCPQGCYLLTHEDVDSPAEVCDIALEMAGIPKECQRTPTDCPAVELPDGRTRPGTCNDGGLSSNTVSNGPATDGTFSCTATITRKCTCG